MRRKWRESLVVTLMVTGLLTVGLAGQSVLSGIGANRSPDWRAALLTGFGEAWPWFLLTPFVLWLINRFPFEAKKLVPPITAHATAYLAALSFCALFRLHQPDYFVPQSDRFVPEGPAKGQADVRLLLNRSSQLRLALQGRGTFYTMIYGLVFLTGQAMRQSRLRREREQQAEELRSRLAEARLQALRLQLQPHFLFNALNTIASHVREEPDRAEEMIAHLSGFLRCVLNERASEEVSLRTELALLDAYLAIQQARFGERLSLHRETAQDALDAMVPTLVLQPLVENAMKHGLENRRGALSIFIGAERKGNALSLRIQDDGRGIEGSNLDNDGVGLGNTRARLQLLYGSCQSFALRANQPSGVIVEITLPWKPAPPMPRSIEEIPIQA